jgi:hypothetical protein
MGDATGKESNDLTTSTYGILYIRRSEGYSDNMYIVLKHHPPLLLHGRAGWVGLWEAAFLQRVELCSFINATTLRIVKRDMTLNTFELLR